MKRIDYIVLTIIALLGVTAMITIPHPLETFKAYTQAHGYLMSFAKFAVLATFGECVALRIVTGKYWRPGFGLIAKAVMWGFLGLFIKASFTVFATGSPMVLPSLGYQLSSDPGFFEQLFIAFITSIMLNTVFAPVLMVLHKIYDDHIQYHKGRVAALFLPVHFRARLDGIDWNIMWGLVLKKTVPYFWIPAQTITFMLPPDARILFAAFLGGVLGVILAFASLSGQREGA
ncbi:hypothetical protein [Pseudodesulfovibrio sp. zrk46]|uniref:hypothetical protein n=1 Tax=Pseudodesulfovibrio sp. zrk46 TaxID=2725288 RepID=UPI001448B784|nr:hypothetical protein [Pseudodesulfovibrio sp. zrk46]QJB56764.1 hypothetical protein HFN16_10260 [Pseudodesulfovibrio sp. zrk46]